MAERKRSSTARSTGRTPSGSKARGQTIVVIGAPEAVERGIFDRNKVSQGTVTADKLAGEVTSFVGVMRTVVDAIAEQAGNYHIDTVQVSAEVSAKGSLSLLGTGGEVGGKGGLIFTFKRTIAAT